MVWVVYMFCFVIYLFFIFLCCIVVFYRGGGRGVICSCLCAC